MYWPTGEVHAWPSQNKERATSDALHFVMQILKDNFESFAYTVRIKKKVIALCSALARSLYNVQKYSFPGGKTRLLAFNCHHFCEI